MLAVSTSLKGCAVSAVTKFSTRSQMLGGSGCFNLPSAYTMFATDCRQDIKSVVLFLDKG